MEITAETLEFIHTHENDDVRTLALKARGSEALDLTFALEQIAGKQKARTKLPLWAKTHGIIFPPHISMEQCSSEATAEYKRRILLRFLAISSEKTGDNSSTGETGKSRDIRPETSDTLPYTYVDFTGGFGVDFSYIAQLFEKSIYIERLPHLCNIARNNLPLLGLADAEVRCVDSEKSIDEFCNDPEAKNTICFLDPARRNENGGRTYAIEDCTPNILGFIGKMVRSVHAVMLKLSPMLDWHATVASLNAACSSVNAVKEIHIVSIANECKEILVILSEAGENNFRVVCMNDENEFVYIPSQLQEHLQTGTTENEDYLYIPNSSVMKAGCFAELEKRFGLKQISSNSHLYTGPSIEGFPGRKMRISAISSMNKKELKASLNGLQRANISTRNFPLSPDELRKRLKLKDGGDTYIVATTTNDKRHLLYICEPCR